MPTIFKQSALFLTRQCNLRCAYCKVPKGAKQTRLSTFDVLLLFDTMKEIGFKMNVLFGGEPMLRHDILDIISYARKIELPYAFISNSSFITPQAVKDLVAAGLDNYTASVDTFDSSDRRSADGQRALIMMKRAGVRDVVANVVVHAGNWRFVPNMIQFFSEMGIWTIIGVIQDCEDDKGWSYRSKSGLGLKALRRDQVGDLRSELLRLYDRGCLIHNVRSYVENLIPYAIDLNWKCKTAAYVPIDEDGTLLTCVDWKGRRVAGNYKLKHLLNPQIRDVYLAERVKDVEECPGCYYNHSWQVEHLGDFDLAHR